VLEQELSGDELIAAVLDHLVAVDGSDAGQLHDALNIGGAALRDAALQHHVVAPPVSQVVEVEDQLAVVHHFYLDAPPLKGLDQHLLLGAH
jgi:hypothetical protein